MTTDYVLEQRLLDEKAELLKKNIAFLRGQCTYTILNLEFFKLYAKEAKLSSVKELTGRYEALIKELLELEE